MRYFLTTLLVIASLQYCAQDLGPIAEEFELLGASLLLYCDGDLAREEYFGLREAGDQLPMNSDSYYRIASISKMVTALGAMSLVEEGLLDLDADVNEYLGYELRNPNFPDEPLTMRMMLSHNAGIQDGAGYNSLIAGTFAVGINNLPSIAQVLVPGGAYYTSNIWRTEAPGSFFAYSNLNFAVVATVMEAVANERFDILMRERIFDPLEITGGFNVAEISDLENLAVLYRWQNGQWQPQVDNFQGTPPDAFPFSNYQPGTNGLYFAPQGGFRASGNDLAKIMELCLGQHPEVLSSATLATMREPEYIYDGTNGDNYFGLFRSWGLGIHRITNTAGGDFIMNDFNAYGHPGEAYGLISDLYFDPGSGNGLIFLTNGAKNGFSFGEESAFYTLEERIFEYAAAYFDAGCPLTVEKLKTKVSELQFFYDSTVKTINIFGDASQATDVVLIDASGKEIARLDCSNDSCSLSLPNLSAGIYHVQARLGEQIWVGRFVQP